MKWIRRHARLLGIAFVVGILLEIGACQVFDAVVKTTDPDGVVRGEATSAAGWTVSYIRQAKPAPGAPRLIFVHGTPGDANAFNNYVQDPMDGFESISMDRPGFGRTRPRRPALTLREQALCIEPLLEERSGTWPILVGHSLGGPIVVQAALDYADRVGGVVILSGSLDPALEKVGWYQRVADFGLFPYMVPRFVRNMNRELLPMKAELRLLEPRLAELRVPVIILHAPNDILVPFANVDFMLRNFPKDRVVDSVVLDGKNHFIPWNAEDAVRAAIARVAAAATPAESKGTP